MTPAVKMMPCRVNVLPVTNWTNTTLHSIARLPCRRYPSEPVAMMCTHRVYCASNDAAQWIPRLVIKPVPKVVEALLHVLCH